MENNKDTQVNTEQVKTYSQEDLDNAVASAKARWEKKTAKDYISLEEYNSLKEQLDKANIELKLPKIKDLLSKSGIKQDAINDFIALNPKLTEMNDKDIAKLIEIAKKEKSYMFTDTSFNATVGDNTSLSNNGNALGIDISNGSLLRTK